MEPKYAGKVISRRTPEKRKWYWAVVRLHCLKNPVEEDNHGI
jgi:hypothetical protein